MNDTQSQLVFACCASSNMIMTEETIIGSKRSELTKTVDARMQKLEEIWNELGIPDDQVQVRYRTVCDHVENLLQGMINEEYRLLNSTRTKISEYESEITNLTTILGATPKVNRHASRIQRPESLILKERQLECALHQLHSMSEKRKIKMESLVKKAEKLESQLTGTRHELVTNFKENTIPSQNEIEMLKRHICDLQQEQCMRRQRFTEQRRHILNLMEEMEIEPSNDIELDIVIADDSQYQMSAETRAQYSILEEKLVKTREERITLSVKLAEKWTSLCENNGVNNDLEDIIGSIKTSHIDMLKSKISTVLSSEPNSSKVRSALSNTKTSLSSAKCSDMTVIKCAETPINAPKDRRPHVGTPAPFCRKLRRRSISDTAIGGRGSKSKQHQGNGYHHNNKHLSPFRFGMSRNGAAWETSHVTTSSNNKSTPRRNKLHHQRTISV